MSNPDQNAEARLKPPLEPEQSSTLDTLYSWGSYLCQTAWDHKYELAALAPAAYVVIYCPSLIPTANAQQVTEAGVLVNQF